MADEHPKWPEPGEHLWGPWLVEKGTPKPVRRRVCVHPECKAVERQAAPIAPMQ